MRLKPRWIVLALGLAVALWALSGYYQWLRDKAAAESLARAMKLAVEQFSPPFAEFSQQNRRPPKDNQELGLAPPRDAHWQGSGFERVELFPNGDVHFEFRLARQHPDAPLVLFVWRIQPRNYLGDGAVVCGARGIPDQVMAWNGLRCDSDVAEPDPKLTAIMLTPALPERAAAATDPLYAALGRDDAAALQALRAAGADLCAHR